MTDWIGNQEICINKLGRSVLLCVNSETTANEKRILDACRFTPVHADYFHWIELCFDASFNRFLKFCFPFNLLRGGRAGEHY